MILVRRVKRGFLLMVGAMGGVLAACLLVQSGAALWQTEPVQTAQVILPEKSVAFPMEIPGTTLVAHHLIWYEGGFLEDGSHEYEANVAAVLLENTGTDGIECARVILHWEDGAYVFDVDMLPPGMQVIVLERSRQSYELYSWTSCEGIQKSSHENWQGIVQVTENDTQLQITNPTNSTLPNVCIHFKDYLKDQNILVGGIAHSYEVGDIPPHTTITAEPYHFLEGYSRIVCVEHQK